MGMFEWVDPTREALQKYLRGRTNFLAALPEQLSSFNLSDAMARQPKPFDRSISGEEMLNNAMNAGPSGLLGKIVWHGSPHKFDKFDASKIGTGEGAQAYGHGVYLADVPDTAGSYIRAGRDLGFTNWDDVGRLADKAFAQANGNKSAAMKILEEEAARTMGDTKRMNLALARQSLERGTNNASLYKADLPDEWIPKMLDWDKPLSQQKSAVEQFKKLGMTDGKEFFGIEGAVPIGKMTGGDAIEAMRLSAHHYGDEIPWAKMNANPGIAASMALQKLGIPGIRYLDGGSRSAGQGSYNYVVFPGLEDQVKILERNGIPLEGMFKMDKK